MKNTLKTIVFFGTDEHSLITLQSLVEAGYNISAVVTKPDSKQGRGQKLTAPDVKKFAIEHGINVLQPSKVSDINDNIQSLGNQLIGILVSFGKLIPESTISLFDYGIINIHPSLLPIYRGPSPIESAIKNNDSQTGVSIMKLTAGMDSGPIFGQTIYKLSGQETRPEMYEKLFKAGTATLLELLPSILDNTIQPTPQDEEKASYCKLLSKEDTFLKPEMTTANQAECLVRAYLDFPRTKISIFEKDIIISKAHVADEQKTPLDILCSDNKYLSIDELIAPSGRTMSAKDFLNGYSR